MDRWQPCIDILQSPYSDSEKFGRILEALHSVQLNDATLLTNTPYSVSLSRGHTAARQKRLDDYAGPDEITQALLRNHGAEWMGDAGKFFCQERRMDYKTSRPVLSRMIQRCICIALNEYMRPFRRAGAFDRILDAAANTVSEYERSSFRERLVRMEADGSRYRNLEMSLGAGATLALGIHLEESYWKKFLPKSGVASFVERARQTQLPALSIEYGPLRVEIVRYYLERLLSSEQSAALPTPLMEYPNTDTLPTTSAIDMTDMEQMIEPDLDEVWSEFIIYSPPPSI